MLRYGNGNKKHPRNTITKHVVKYLRIGDISINFANKKNHDTTINY